MSVPSVQRRGSFFQTWWMFARGAGRTWTLILGLFFGFAIQFVVMAAMRPNAHGHPKAINDLLCYVLIVFTVAWAAWHLESEMGERLGYMSIVPQPVDTRRLVIAPMCTLGLALAILLAVCGGLPVPAAPALVGVAWWTVAATRWLWKIRFWPLLLFPVFAAAPLAVHAAQRAAGWGAAAAVSLVLAIGALAFQPRPYVGESVLRRLDGRRTEGWGPVRATSAGAISSAASDRTWLAGAGRFMQLSFGEHRWTFVVVLVAFGVALGLAFPFIGRDAVLFLAVLIIPGNALGCAYSGDMHEFLLPRPFTRGQRFIGGVIPALLLALIAPVTLACLVNLDWINHSGLIGLFKHRVPGADDIRYLREVLGATFLPATWPADGLPQHLWVQLRPLLYLDVLRASLLILALLFALPMKRVGDHNPRGSLTWSGRVIVAAVFGALMSGSLSVFFGSGRFVPGLWLMALLTCVSIAHWTWRLRSLTVPAKLTGGPS